MQRENDQTADAVIGLFLRRVISLLGSFLQIQTTGAGAGGGAAVVAAQKAWLQETIDR